MTPIPISKIYAAKARSLVSYAGMSSPLVNEPKTFFSSASAVSGAIPGVPFTLQGDDIKAQFKEFRSQTFGAGTIYKPARESRHRRWHLGITG